MGFLSGLAGPVIADHAQRAWDEGLSVFVPVLTTAASPGAAPAKGWAESLQAIEAVGWKLDTWAVTAEKQMLTAIPLYRRP